MALWVLFADGVGADVGWGAIGLLVGGVATAVAAAYVTIFTAWHKAKMESNAATAAGKAEETKTTVGYLYQHIDQLYRLIDQLKQEVARCRAAERMSESRAAKRDGYILYIYEFCRRIHDIARAAGLPVGPAPTPPPEDETPHEVEAAFAERTVEHETNLIKRERDEAPAPEAQP